MIRWGCRCPTKAPRIFENHRICHRLECQMALATIGINTGGSQKKRERDSGGKGKEELDDNDDPPRRTQIVADDDDEADMPPEWWQSRLPSPPVLKREEIDYSRPYHSYFKPQSLETVEREFDLDVQRKICETQDLHTMYEFVIEPLCRQIEEKWVWYYNVYSLCMEAQHIIIQNFLSGAYNTLIGYVFGEDPPIDADDLNLAFRRVVQQYAKLAKQRGWTARCQSVSIPRVQGTYPNYAVQWEIFEIDYDPNDHERPGPMGM